MEKVIGSVVLGLGDRVVNRWRTGFLGQWNMYDFIVIQAGSVCEVSILSCQFCCEPQTL